jgi:hypothetical protein
MIGGMDDKGVTNELDKVLSDLKGPDTKVSRKHTDLDCLEYRSEIQEGQLRYKFEPKRNFGTVFPKSFL